MTDSFESSILEELSWRGFIDQTTHDELDEALADDSQTVYCGFDPSASSLHVGNLLGLVVLTHFLRHGHTPIGLVGGATGLIGDPSGKDEERDLLDAGELQSNLESIRGQIQRFFEDAADIAESTAEPRVVNNADWLSEWSFIDFLRDVGRYFRVNKMMQKESVRARLEEREQGISYTEFSYQLIQAFDFVQLFEDYGCRIQIGGSDQYGNITAGTELVRRKKGETVFGLSFPLLTSAEGKKIGKSEDGAVYLDPEMTSPYDFYQYWVSVDDRDCGTLLRQFTFLSRDEIQELEGTIERGENRGEVQKKLAWEVTALVHGEETADQVVKAAEILFGGTVEGLSDEELLSIFSDAPSTEMQRQRLGDGELGIVDAFAETGLQNSKGATRRLIKQGGAYLNNVRVEDKQRVLSEDDLASESMLVLRSGKKNYHVVRFA